MDDRISMLPNEILCHILSFLPTEDVYATTVLSKRWMHLPLVVPTLDINDQRFMETRSKSYPNFMMMVCATLFAQMVPRYIENKIPITRVTISLYAGVETTLFKNSLTALAERGMSHLELLLFLPCSPCFIFSFRTLVVLKLKEISFNEFSTVVELASLKILHLFKVYFKQRWYLSELLNGCPILEEFEAKDLTLMYEWGFHGDKDKFIRLSNLIRANINNIYPFYHIPPLTALSNVQFLRLEEVYDRGVFSNLTHLELVFARMKPDWYMVYGMLNDCPNLRYFLFDKPQLLKQFDQRWFEPRVVPKCFSSQFRKCKVTNYRYELEFVKYIIKNSTSMESVILHTPPFIDPFDKLEVLNELFSVVGCSPTCEIIFI
ncbi:F-box/FBD/LRR-repeat protein At5g56420-like [Vicia villosa]|uniref:F-box/FBD/LRR-repeat protein At5g56420-like n=1 Tax=Vicia villosa TaxID=3911 RepID=UPI00273C96B7|nr:F-box/FBD/LRR-repeat protein At5g56420-like [Vicia villosa]